MITATEARKMVGDHLMRTEVFAKLDEYIRDRAAKGAMAVNVTAGWLGVNAASGDMEVIKNRLVDFGFRCFYPSTPHNTLTISWSMEDPQ